MIDWRNRNRSVREQQGFTLIELLVVIIILGILAAVVVFAVQGAGDKGAESAHASDAKTIRTAQEAFCARFGRYASEAELVLPPDGAGFLSEESTLHETAPGPRGACKGANVLTSTSFTITCQVGKAGCGAAGAVPSEGSWTATGKLNVARDDHTTTLLANGKVLVAGGKTTTGTITLINGAELYDPLAGNFTTTGALTQPRWRHTATFLTAPSCTGVTPPSWCGKVLVVGGFGPTYYPGGDPAPGILPGCPTTGTTSTNCQPVLNTAELYDPVAGTWSSAGTLTTRRALHMAGILPDGKVLVAGGRSCGAAPPAVCSSTTQTSTAEIYDPGANTWSAGPALSINRHTTSAAVLNDGRVLVAAGFGGTNASTTGQIYNQTLNSWTATANLPVGRTRQGATVLQNGKVMFAGGFGGANTAVLYDPAANSWATTGPIAQSARSNHKSTVLPNGKLLMAGGAETGFADSQTVLTAEIYNPATNQWTSAGLMRDRHGGTSSLTNADLGIVLSASPTAYVADPGVCGSNCGRVLLVGNNPGGTAELYTPSP